MVTFVFTTTLQRGEAKDLAAIEEYRKKIRAKELISYPSRPRCSAKIESVGQGHG